MLEEAGTAGLPSGREDQASACANPSAMPPRIVPLLLSVLLIAMGAVIFACLLAAGFVLMLYARDGTEGVSGFYEDYRFDLRLKTLVSAIVVGALYLGVTLSTLLAARIHARTRWPFVLAWRPAQGSRRLVLAICAATLAYGAIATLIVSLNRDHRVLVAGNTDLALLLTITANLVLFAPLAEELLFRGWLFTGLRARLPFWPSFLATVALFAATHWGAGRRRTLLVIPLAAALGFLREVAGSIKPTIALHAIYNLVIVTLTLLVS